MTDTVCVPITFHLCYHYQLHNPLIIKHWLFLMMDSLSPRSSQKTAVEYQCPVGSPRETLKGAHSWASSAMAAHGSAKTSSAGMPPSQSG